MAEDSEVLVDWLVCCGCENDAAKFVKSGIDCIKKVRNFQFKKIEPSGWMNENFCRLKDRTRTEEELSQEVSVSECVCVCVVCVCVCVCVCHVCVSDCPTYLPSLRVLYVSHPHTFCRAVVSWAEPNISRVWIVGLHTNTRFCVCHMNEIVRLQSDCSILFTSQITPTILVLICPLLRV